VVGHSCVERSVDRSTPRTDAPQNSHENRDPGRRSGEYGRLSHTGRLRTGRTTQLVASRSPEVPVLVDNSSSK
jgi:hypothetical protein